MAGRIPSSVRLPSRHLGCSRVLCASHRTCRSTGARDRVRGKTLNYCLFSCNFAYLLFAQEKHAKLVTQLSHEKFSILEESIIISKSDPLLYCTPGSLCGYLATSFVATFVELTQALPWSSPRHVALPHTEAAAGRSDWLGS